MDVAERQEQEFELWPGQYKLLNELSYPHHVLAPGVGYGKTTFGCRWLHFRVMLNERPFKYAILAPTHKLLKECFDIYESLLLASGWKENVHYQMKRSTGDMEIIYKNKARVLGVSAQNYKSIVTYTFASAWLDEPGHLDELVFPEIVKRVRQGGAKVVQLLRTGVPQGRGDSSYFRTCTGPEYSDFGRYQLAGEGSFSRFRCDGRRLILHGSTHENPVNDAEYVANLRDDFGWSKSLWNQQVHGLFVGASVKSLYDFDRDKHSGDYEPNPTNPKRWLVWDFNVGQVSWLCVEQRNGHHYVVAEYCEARDTPAACAKFIQMFPPETYGWHDITVTGDASGWARDTRSYSNDYEIIRELLTEFYPETQILAPRSNPDVRLSIVAVNRLLNENPMTGQKIKLFVNHKCAKVITSLLSTEPDGRGGIAKPGGDTWTHPADALRYYVDLVAPLHRRIVRGANY